MLLFVFHNNIPIAKPSTDVFIFEEFHMIDINKQVRHMSIKIKNKPN